MSPSEHCAPGSYAYQALIDEHYQRVLRLCRLLLGDPQEAQDVTQETFLKLHQHHRDARISDWGAWLTRVAVNGARDRRRAGWWRYWWRHSQPLETTPLAATSPLPDAVAVDEATRRRIAAAFATLPRRQREVFALRQIDGLSTAETAEALGLSEGSVKQHLFRAIQALRQVLEGLSE